MRVEFVNGNTPRLNCRTPEHEPTRRNHGGRLACQLGQQIHERLRDDFWMSRCLFKRCQNKLALDVTDHLLRVTVAESMDREGTHSTGQDPIANGRRPAALEVAKNEESRVESHAACFHLEADAMDTAVDCALGHDHDPRRFAALLLLFQFVDDIVNLERDLGNQGGIGSGRQCSVHGDLAAISAHHLDEEQTLGRVGRVADLVDGFRGGANGTT